MAIVKMKKLCVMAMASQRQQLLRELLHLGCVEISEPDGKLADPAWSALLKRENSHLLDTKSEITDVNTALAAIKKYAQLKDGLFIQRHPISEAEFLGDETAERARAACKRIDSLLQTISGLQSEEGRLRAKRASLEPWKGLDVPLENQGTAHVLFRMGVCPGSTDTGAVRQALDQHAADIFEVGADKQQTYYFLICLRDEEQAVMDSLRPFNFSAVTFQDMTGTAEENLRALDALLSENEASRKAAEAEIVKNAPERDALRLYADRLTAEAAKESNTERLLTDGTILFFEGWAPAERMGQVSDLLERLGCAWEARDPTEEEYPSVPVQLKNNWLTRPLNMVTEMYSLPAYDNVDPNPLMAPFFILFYGIMMADMGYGILMILAGLFITKKYRPKGTMGHMFSLVTLCGVSTFIMGAITGGFFGDFLPQLAAVINPESTFALPALFTPLDDTMMILVGAMCLGFIQIVTGMAISVAEKLRRGQVMDAVWGEITWWIIFAGLALAILGITPLVLAVGGAMVVAGSLVTGKGIGKITGIVATLYNNVTGYFGDILSYSRLMALMLAGSVIAQVFNTLGAIPGNVVIFLVISLAGNALNFALNLLGCYVHDLRLQCLEFFKTFYVDGGKPFRPLRFNTKYYDVAKS